MPPRSSTLQWTPERIEKVRELWQAGFSGNQIADKLGGVTRNAVIGKLHRLGLSRTDKPKTGLVAGGRKAARLYRKKGREMRAAKTASSRRVSAPVPQADGYVPPIMSETAPPNATTLHDLRPDQCRWPYGDEAFVFCPEPQVLGSSYCPGHHVRVYAGIPVQKRRPH